MLQDRASPAEALEPEERVNRFTRKRNADSAFNGTARARFGPLRDGRHECRSTQAVPSARDTLKQRRTTAKPTSRLRSGARSAPNLANPHLVLSPLRRVLVEIPEYSLIQLNSTVCIPLRAANTRRGNSSISDLEREI